ncbi:hypothetical protein LCGC14_3102460 [marine sediment metagenome]|uniref:ABC transporter domain-containing protein n=1 Tax=marine sediment metagenome TaxID=412755 RepID=A0A0F8WW82_9ZZZZ
MNLITLENVTQIYERKNILGIPSKRRTIALSDVNLTFKENSITLFLGPSGSGKTTLMNIISTLTIPTVGRVTFRNKIVQDFKDLELQDMRRKIIGYMHQELFNNF